MKQGFCDRCNGPIKKPQGYLVWNPISELTTKHPVGTMLLCYKCARKIFSSSAVEYRFFTLEETDIWKINMAQFNLYLNSRMVSLNLQSDDLFKSGHFAKIASGLDEIYILGIVQRMRRRGLSKKQAMKWARELGELWWSDPAKAERIASKKKMFGTWK